VQPFVMADDDDLDFINHAREDVPALLAEVERLRAGLRTVQAADCCGCSLYADVAEAVLDGRDVELLDGGRGIRRVEPAEPQ
jgi:hypothetical protein